MASTTSSNPPAIHIQSYIRVRPLGNKGKRIYNVEFKNKEVVIKSENSRNDKILAFDRVFNEATRQETVYNTVVKPMVQEVLQGYNCTVFAYGQTGTGKTYTMTGEQIIPNQENKDAGIIPRVMEDIFTRLDESPSAYQVSVVYIELYNEKLQNLLSDEYTSCEQENLQMLDDVDGGVNLKGVLPTLVKSPSEAFRLLQKGMDKRQRAATFMNENSSRSHTIFTIYVTIREMSTEDRDFVRVGKLHLIDLAGSENATKSGASDLTNQNALGANRRMTETSNINRSLLTLGRVITSITENNSHIPYRESKLTRFLKDSLGGRTKTCIIATISPAQANQNETESTLNYACRARSIKNKPEKNRNLSDQEYMQTMTDETARLEHELETLRAGNGFHISPETYDEIISNNEEMEKELDRLDKEYNEVNTADAKQLEEIERVNAEYFRKCAEYELLEKADRLQKERHKKELKMLAREEKVRIHLIQAHQSTEAELITQANTCNSVIETLLTNNDKLHDKIQRRVIVENKKLESLVEIKTTLTSDIDQLIDKIVSFVDMQKKFDTDVTDHSKRIFDQICVHIAICEKEFDALETIIMEHTSDTVSRELQLVNEMKGAYQYNGECSHKYESEIIKIEDKIGERATSVMDIIKSRFGKLQDIISHIKGLNNQFKEKIQEETVKEEANTREMVVTIDRIMESIREFKNQYKNILEDTDKTQLKAKLAVEKAKQIVEATKELDALFEETELATETVESTMFSYIKNVNDLKNSSSTKIREYQARFGSTVRQMFTSGDEYNYFNTQINNELGNVSEDVEQDADILLPGIDSEYDQFSSTITGFLRSGESKIQSVINANMTHLTERAQIEKTLKEKFECIEDRMKKRLSELLKCSEIDLREIFNKYSNHIDNVKAEESLTTSIFENIAEETEILSYPKDVPTGLTPKRVTLDQLEFPRQLSSTAPKEVLIQRFLQSQGFIQDDSQNAVECHVPIQTTKPNEESECMQSTETLEEDRVQDRLLSAPDMAELEISALSLEENDKENVAIPSSEKRKGHLKPKQKCLKESNNQIQ